MSTQYTINRFFEGMDTDSDKGIVKPTAYRIARNLRFTTDTASTSSSISTVPGNELISINLSDVFTDYSDNPDIVGMIPTNTGFVLFITTNRCDYAPNTELYESGSAILKIDIDANGNVYDRTVLYKDSSEKGFLNFSTSYPIKGIYRYEKEDVQKIYWTDGYHNIRYCNIADPNLNSYNIESFEFIPSFSMSMPEVVDILGGNLKVGIYQYSYQLIKKSGGETLFAPPSKPLPLIKENVGSNNVYFTSEGGNKDESSGKSVKVSIDLTNNYFDRIRVISIRYEDSTSVPFINIIGDFDITQDQTIVSVIDNGTYDGEIPAEEFSIVFKNLFSCRDIETKDNMLFAANIKESDFDVDFDARAYRCNIYGNYRIYGKHVENDAYSGQDTYIEGTGRPQYDSVWAEKLVSNGSVIRTLKVSEIPLEYDCLNGSNTMDKDSLLNPSNVEVCFLYQYGSSPYGNTYLMGGEGVNISYTFGIKQVRIDSSNVIDLVYEFKNNFQSSFTNYGGYNSQKIAYSYVGYKRDEIYRFGIQFADKYGRWSTVKWIGDIRFPSVDLTNTNVGNTSFYTYDSNLDGSLDERDFKTFFKATSGYSEVYMNVLYPKFKVRNIPAEAVAYRIVRAYKTDNDKTIIASGVLATAVKKSTEYVYYSHYIPTCRSGSDLTSSSVFSFISPDVTFIDKVSYSTGDFITAEGVAFGPDDVVNRDSYERPQYSVYDPKWNSSNFSGNVYVFKYKDMSPTGLFIKRNVTSSSRKFTVSTKIEDSDVTDIDGTNTYKHYGFDPRGLTNFQGLAGTRFVVRLDSPITLFSSTTYGQFPLIIADYHRNNYNSIYGGNTYNAIKRTEYIPCGNLFKEGDSQFSRTSTFGSFAEVFGGDTYIGYFEYMYTLHNANVGTSTNRTVTLLLVPLESYVNVAYRNGKTYIKDKSDPYAFAIQEFAGAHNAGGGNTYVQENNLYSYNEVFSTVPFAQKYMSYDEDIELDRKYPYRIVASDRKIDGEFSDSWTTFRYNVNYDVESEYGFISNIMATSNGLLFWQARGGFGIVSVNERSLIEDSSVGSLLLGSGGVLQRHFYISRIYGNSNLFGVVRAGNGIYWVDNNKNEILKTDGQSILSVSKHSKIHNYMCSVYDKIGDVVAEHDIKNGEVLFCIKPWRPANIIQVFSDYVIAVFNSCGISHGSRVMLETPTGIRIKFRVFNYPSCDPNSVSTVVLQSKGIGYADIPELWDSSVTFKITPLQGIYSSIGTSNYDNKVYETLVFSEETSSFRGADSFYPGRMYKNNGMLFSTVEDTSTSNFLYKHGSGDPCKFYGAQHPAYIRFIVNDKYNFTKVFDNFIFYTDVIEDSKYTFDDSNLTNRVQFKTFDKIRVYNDWQDSGYVDIVYDENIKRREREWHMQVPRVSGTGLFKPRIRDKYIVVELVLDDFTSVGKFVMPYFITSYRISIR